MDDPLNRHAPESCPQDTAPKKEGIRPMGPLPPHAMVRPTADLVESAPKFSDISLGGHRPRSSAHVVQIWQTSAKFSGRRPGACRIRLVSGRSWPRSGPNSDTRSGLESAKSAAISAEFRRARRDFARSRPHLGRPSLAQIRPNLRRVRTDSTEAQQIGLVFGHRSGVFDQHWT